MSGRITAVFIIYISSFGYTQNEDYPYVPSFHYS